MKSGVKWISLNTWLNKTRTARGKRLTPDLCLEPRVVRRPFGLDVQRTRQEEPDLPTAADSAASRLELVFTHKRCKLSLAGDQRSLEGPCRLVQGLSPALINKAVWAPRYPACNTHEGSERQLNSLLISASSLRGCSSSTAPP